MKKAFIVALAVLGSFACSAAVDEQGEESGEATEQGLGQPALSCPTSLTMKTSLGAFGVGAIGRVRTIRARIASTLVCEATGDPVPAFSKNFSTAAVTSALADLIGTLSTSTDRGDFVFKFKVAGIVVQTKRLSCPTESFNVSSSGWNTNSGTLTATASIINGSPTNFLGTCTYTAPATSVRVTRVKPSNVFAAIGSSFYAKSALNDTELRNVCTSNCNTQCTSNIPSGSHLDGVAECINSCINSCVIR